MKAKSNQNKSESDDARPWIENPQCQVLRVELSDGSFHLCPYSWLVWVRFSPQDNADTVVLVFNSNNVSITGKNLRELALAFQRMAVECLKPQPKQVDSGLNSDFPIIQTIRVEKAQEGTG
jgi:hypothetical protein